MPFNAFIVHYVCLDTPLLLWHLYLTYSLESLLTRNAARHKPRKAFLVQKENILMPNGLNRRNEQ